jgi:hypothetical protein
VERSLLHAKWWIAAAALVGPGALAQRPAPTAYVPDKSCPFLRESQDPSTENLLKSVQETVNALATKCDRKLEAPLETFRRAITELGNQSGVTRLQDPGPSVPGYLGIGVTCANYPDLLRSEYEAALATVRAGAREFPSEDYRRCLSDKTPDRCVQRLYVDKMREQRHRCLMAREQDKWQDQRKRYEALAEQVGASLNAIVIGADQCRDGAGPYVDLALQGLGLFATMSPAFGPYGMGVALGADVLRQIANRATPTTLLRRHADTLKRRAALDRLACLYLDMVNATVDCPKRLEDLREKYRRASSAAPGMEANGPPKEAVELMGRISDVQSLFRRVREVRNDRRQVLALLRTLGQQLDRTPVHVPSGMPPGFTAIPSLRDYLKGSADWLSEFRKKGVRGSDDVFLARDIEAQGRQLKAALDAYERLLVPDLSDADFDDALATFLDTIDPPAHTKEPALDLEETMFHLFDRYDPSYRFAEVAALQLMRSTQPTTRAATGEARDKLLRAFTVLVREMQDFATEYFDDTAAKPHLTVANPRASTQTQLRQTFDGVLQPLFRSCSLLAGLLYYEAEPGGRRTPLTHLRGGRDAKFRVPLPFHKDIFPTACRPFLCDNIESGVLPFHRIDPNRPEVFHDAQCWAMHSYEARLSAARRNYMTTGNVCRSPEDPAAAPPPAANPATRPPHAPPKLRSPR